MGATKFMSKLDEKLKLTEGEKVFLKKIVNHWITKKTWFVATGDSKDWYAGESAFTVDEKLAARNLIINHLLEVKLIPSTKQLLYGSKPKVNIGTTSFEIPVDHPVNEQNFFDWIFKPTKKGLSHCFVEEV